MGTFSPYNVIALLAAILIAVPLWRIFPKFGVPKWVSILTAFGIYLVLMLLIAPRRY